MSPSGLASCRSRLAEDLSPCLLRATASLLRLARRAREQRQSVERRIDPVPTRRRHDGANGPVERDRLERCQRPSLHAGERDIPDGGIPAARWLRAHSRPDQVVATNTNCRKVTHGTCDNRHFWIAGFTERRVLVESWGYTSPIYEEAWAGRGAFFLLPYWDRQRLTENDQLFRNPSKSAADLLRRKYGVRWLLVDRRYDPPSPKLADIWVRDGAVLDDESLAVLEQQAAASGHTIWVERVGSRDPGVIVIHDGQVASS